MPLPLRKNSFALLLATVGFLFLPSGSHSSDDSSSNEIPVIDAHTHTNFEESGAGRPNLQDYLREWQQANVVGAVSHTSRAGKGYVPDLSDRVVFCFGIGNAVDLAAVENGLRTGRFGCIKIYLGYVYRYASDAAYAPLYKLAAKYDVPVVFHTGDTNSEKGKLKYADPLTIDEVAVDNPGVNFVIAHCGNPWIESAAEVAYKNHNVYLECSALLTGDLGDRSEQDVETYVVRPISWIFGYVEDPKKLMFGTDWPLTRIKPYADAYKRAIPQKYWRLVLHDNAANVFHFSRLKSHHVR
ncbi:MAG TPA: amidohydrolase family protein [Candidatus Angelobacter sp.]